MDSSRVYQTVFAFIFMHFSYSVANLSPGIEWICEDSAPCLSVVNPRNGIDRIGSNVHEYKLEILVHRRQTEKESLTEEWASDKTQVTWNIEIRWFRLIEKGVRVPITMCSNKLVCGVLFTDQESVAASSSPQSSYVVHHFEVIVNFEGHAAKTKTEISIQRSLTTEDIEFSRPEDVAGLDSGIVFPKSNKDEMDTSDYFDVDSDLSDKTTNEKPFDSQLYEPLYVNEVNKGYDSFKEIQKENSKKEPIPTNNTNVPSIFDVDPAPIAKHVKKLSKSAIIFIFLGWSILSTLIFSCLYNYCRKKISYWKGYRSVKTRPIRSWFQMVDSHTDAFGHKRKRPWILKKLADMLSPFRTRHRYYTPFPSGRWPFKKKKKPQEPEYEYYYEERLIGPRTSLTFFQHIGKLNRCTHMTCWERTKYFFKYILCRRCCVREKDKWELDRLLDENPDDDDEVIFTKPTTPKSVKPSTGTTNQSPRRPNKPPQPDFQPVMDIAGRFSSTKLLKSSGTSSSRCEDVVISPSKTRQTVKTAPMPIVTVTTTEGTCTCHLNRGDTGSKTTLECQRSSLHAPTRACGLHCIQNKRRSSCNEDNHPSTSSANPVTANLIDLEEWVPRTSESSESFSFGSSLEATSVDTQHGAQDTEKPTDTATGVNILDRTKQYFNAEKRSMGELLKSWEEKLSRGGRESKVTIGKFSPELRRKRTPRTRRSRNHHVRSSTHPSQVKKREQAVSRHKPDIEKATQWRSKARSHSTSCTTNRNHKPTTSMRTTRPSTAHPNDNNKQQNQEEVAIPQLVRPGCKTSSEEEDDGGQRGSWFFKFNETTPKFEPQSSAGPCIPPPRYSAKWATEPKQPNTKIPSPREVFKSFATLKHHLTRSDPLSKKPPIVPNKDKSSNLDVPRVRRRLGFSPECGSLRFVEDDKICKANEKPSDAEPKDESHDTVGEDKNVPRPSMGAPSCGHSSTSVWSSQEDIYQEASSEVEQVTPLSTTKDRSRSPKPVLYIGRPTKQVTSSGKCDASSAKKKALLNAVQSFIDDESPGEMSSDDDVFWNV